MTYYQQPQQPPQQADYRVYAPHPYRHLPFKHGIHVFLSFITCGFYIPVWMFLVFMHGRSARVARDYYAAQVQQYRDDYFKYYGVDPY